MKKLHVLTAFGLAALLSAPLVALGAIPDGIHPEYITPYSDKILAIINNILVPVIIGIAFIVFLWGVFKYFILGADNETARDTGRQFVLWGIIGFVVILSVWGLVNLVRGTFGLTTENNPPPPTFNTGGNAGDDINT